MSLAQDRDKENLQISEETFESEILLLQLFLLLLLLLFIILSIMIHLIADHSC